MSTDDRITSRKPLIVVFILGCMSLIAMCYVRALPPAPLISIRSQKNALFNTSAIAHINNNNNSSIVTPINETVNAFAKYKRTHARKSFTLPYTIEPIVEMPSQSHQLTLPLCDEPNLENVGPIKPNITLVSLDDVEAELEKLVETGGFYEPKDCKAKFHVAIIVPFRDRYAHLSIFLRNIHPFLIKQNISYRIFIIEQTMGQPFNRAALFNVGFLEALKFFKWDCFIFHDVDLLPLDDRNLYNCPRQPRHMSVATDTFNYKLPYNAIFGGVSAMTRKQFEAVNGFSNSYFGWGGEDDDMSNRIKHAGFFISRYPINIARYTMLKHRREKANPKRFENLANGINKIKLDGLNSIKYTVYSIKEFQAFTWCLIELNVTQPKS